VKKQGAPGPGAVVVGASGAIGQAIAADLGKDHRVFAADVVVRAEEPRPRAGRSAKAPANGVRKAHVDVRDEASVRALRERVRAELGGLDALVYCVGVLPRGTLRAAGVRGWQEAFDVNVLGAVRCVRVFAELMASAATGRIVLLGSVTARTALAGAGAYAATKAALESLARTAAVELAPAGISVVCVSPGYVASEMTTGMETHLGDVPLKRMARAEDIAEVVRAVLSVRSPYMTGTRIEIAGGLQR
jgi:3-oxoacyl-[acyl-carrier protein] reductase